MNKSLEVANNNNMKTKIIFILIILMTYSLIALNGYSNLFNKQLILVIAGIVLLILSKFLNIELLFKYSFIIYVINIILLVLVLFIGKEVNGSRAWLEFKGLNLQPSELMKLSLILFLSNYLNQVKFNISIKNDFLIILKVILIFLLPSILTFIEPDTGNIIIYIVIVFSLLFISNINYKWLLGIFISGLIIFVFLFGIYYFYPDNFISIFGSSMFYRIDRIINLTNNLQLENALISIGTTGLFGHQDVPLTIIEAPTDFIFTLLLTKIGFIPIMILIIFYLVLAFYLIKICRKVNNEKYKYFIFSLLTVFIFQTIYSIMMNIGLLPIMGITLPLISYGGSSFLTFIILFVITNNIIDNNKVDSS